MFWGCRDTFRKVVCWKKEWVLCSLQTYHLCWCSVDWTWSKQRSEGLNLGKFHQKLLMRSRLRILLHFVLAAATNVGIDYSSCSHGVDDSSFCPTFLWHEAGVKNDDEDCCLARSRSHWIDSLFLDSGTSCLAFSFLFTPQQPFLLYLRAAWSSSVK